jgi:choice-of-anchor B domain-containing protein
MSRMSGFFVLVQILFLPAPDGRAVALATGAPSSRTQCIGGMANRFPCDGIDLLSHMLPSQLGGALDARLNDIWGWTDSVSGREFAIVGRTDGTAFVEVTDHTAPVLIGSLPGAAGPSNWRDMKTIGHYVVIVSEAAGHGMQIFDLRRLLSATALPVTFNEDARYSGTDRAHNVAVDEESGFAYMVGASGTSGCGGGLHMIDMAAPTNPTFAGCFAVAGTGRGGTGYVHDAHCVVYRGPDSEHRGKQICFGANETHVTISDVTDKSAGVALATATYAFVGYVHSGWLTEDHRYFLQNDELDETGGIVSGTTLRVWDVSDLDAPELASIYTASTAAIDHNVLVRGSFAYLTSYTAGLRVLDVSAPEDPHEIAFFDTYPASEAAQFFGSWGVYPFFESGTVVVSDFDEGLFILEPPLNTVSTEGLAENGQVTLSAVWPNPFTDRVSFSLSLERSGWVEIALHDLLGRVVATVYDGLLASGQVHRFDVESERDLPSGLYVLRVSGPGLSASRPVTRIR